MLLLLVKFAAALPSAVAIGAIPTSTLRGSTPAVAQAVPGAFHEASRRLPYSTSSFRYIGCLENSSDDIVYGSIRRSTGMTPDVCFNHCNEIGTMYMAITEGSVCWCTTEDGLEYDRHGDGICDEPCAGDDTEICGGENGFDLYELDTPASPTDEEYLDCFADSKEDRVLSDMIIKSNMTPSLCREHCVGEEDIRFYGTQFGNECWCGISSSFRDYDRHGLGVCNMPCAGNATISCGGFEAFDLFEIKEASELSTTSPTGVAPAPAPTPTPVAAPISSPSANPTFAPVEEDFSGSTGPGNLTDLLDVHNQVRCIHGADPLVWSEEVAAVAQNYAAVLASTNCGSLIHSDNGYGENLFTCSSSAAGCYNAPYAMNSLYENEITSGSVEEYDGHATQILWKSTTELGCAVDSCVSGSSNVDVLVCNYNPPGNVVGNYLDEVERPSKTAEECGFTYYED